MKEAIEHYEAALKAAFPEGASGEVFNHWNEARKALAQPQDDCDGCGEVCRRSQLCYGCDRELEEANARLGQPQGEHKTDGTPCWCNPEVTYENPETGAKVIVHREPQGEDTQCLIYVADVDMPEGFRDHMERIAELEQDPQSKAALDRARDRFAGGGKVIEWVDLTDYEIGVAFTGSPCLIPHQNQINGLRAVIAKFKEKNTPNVVPDGYALISIDALKAWGKHEEVSNACCYPIHEPVVQQGEPVAWRCQYCNTDIPHEHASDCWVEIVKHSTTPPSVEAMRIETLEKAANAAEVAMLGADRELVKRVLKAIRRMK